MKRLVLVSTLILTPVACKSTNPESGTSAVSEVREGSAEGSNERSGQSEMIGEAKGSSYFLCTKSGNGYRPYYMRWDEASGTHIDYSKKTKGLLGAGVMRSESECQQALDAANHEFGVICSATGLGWKPTLYTGTVPGRADYGYLGGSSMNKFEDCLLAVRSSSEKGVCFYGGVGPYYVARIDRAQTISRPFTRLEDCVKETRPE